MITPPSFAPDAAPKPGPRAGTRPSVIGIGASTGGIDAISEVLANLPTAVMPPIILVQHSRGDQAERLAKVLRQASPMDVIAAQAGQRLQPGYLYLPARYGEHVRVTGTDGLRLFMSDAPPRNGHRPSIDELFSSLADLSMPTLGILLTGMGRDGAEGLRKMRSAGNLTIAQDAASSLVYGMPRAAVELGAATEQLSPQQIGHRLAEICLT